SRGWLRCAADGGGSTGILRTGTCQVGLEIRIQRRRITELKRSSRAVKNSGQLIGVFAFAVESTAYRSEGRGEGKNVARDEQIGILDADRVPVHTIGCDSNFRHQIGSTHGDTFAGRAPQRNSADHPVLGRNPFLIEELTE